MILDHQTHLHSDYSLTSKPSKQKYPKNSKFSGVKESVLLYIQILLLGSEAENFKSKKVYKNSFQYFLLHITKTQEKSSL